MANLVRWTFFDPSVPETYTFAVNPNSGGSPDYAKTLTTQPTTAPGGKTLLFEGEDRPSRFEFAGVLRTEAQFDAFVTWWNKRLPIRITDDLGRQFWIYIDTFTPRRVRARRAIWKHSYSVEATVTA